MKNALMIRIRSIGLLLILILVVGISPAFAITWGTGEKGTLVKY